MGCKAGHCIGYRLQSIWEGVLDCIFRPYWFRCFTLVLHLGAAIYLVELLSLLRYTRD